MDTAATPTALKQRIDRLRVEQPTLRARDAALELGISEAEYVAASCGFGARRLAGPWPALVQGLPPLGTVMALTRNDHAVHEKVGRYDKISVGGDHGLVLNHDIDLRIFFSHWHAGFAVSETTSHGLRHSLQFFDGSGSAVHKIYLRPESDLVTYEALIAAHLSDDQSAGQRVAAKPAAKADRADSEIDVAALRGGWDALEDVHDFFTLLRSSGTSRVQAFRLAGPAYAVPVPAGSFRRAIEGAAQRGLPIMVFVGNPGMVQIHSGSIETVKEVGPWFNILDPGFNLHLRVDGIDQAWVVRKPTRDGIVTSLEVFDASGEAIAYMFGERKPGKPELEGWRMLVAGLEAAVA
jgi:putative hemin transport protein